MEINQRIRGMLGFAMRAGKVVIGTEQVCVAMAKKGRLKLVLLTVGASEGTKKKVRVKSEYYGIPLLDLDIDSEELGKLLGKTTTPMCLGITDENFASEIKKAAVSL